MEMLQIAKCVSHCPNYLHGKLISDLWNGPSRDDSTQTAGSHQRFAQWPLHQFLAMIDTFGRSSTTKIALLSWLFRPTEWKQLDNFEIPPFSYPRRRLDCGPDLTPCIHHPRWHPCGIHYVTFGKGHWSKCLDLGSSFLKLHSVCGMGRFTSWLALSSASHLYWRWFW